MAIRKMEVPMPMVNESFRVLAATGYPFVA
jgi:hypothetical protein